MNNIVVTAQRELWEFAPKCDTMSEFFPPYFFCLFAAPEQELMFCLLWNSQGQKELSVHFLSVNNTLVRFVHNNILFEYLTGHFLGEWCVPNPCLLCDALLSFPALLWMWLDSAPRWALPPNSHRPPWQQSRLWQLQIPHPRFFLHYPAPVQQKARTERLTTPQSPKLLRRAGKPQRAFSCLGCHSSCDTTD